MKRCPHCGRFYDKDVHRCPKCNKPTQKYSIQDEASDDYWDTLGCLSYVEVVKRPPFYIQNISAEEREGK